MSETAECKKCSAPALPNRTLCQVHTDKQREYQAQWLAKKNGGVPAPRARAVVRQAAPPTDECESDIQVERPTAPLDLDRAILRCTLDLETLMAARDIIRRMGAQ